MRSKRKDKRKKKKENSTSSSKDDNCSIEAKNFEPSPIPSQRVDEEGYIIRSPSISQPKDKFYSSSDDDSEVEEKELRKIHIEIKPLTNGTPMSASVDELRATVGTISLSPLTQHTVGFLLD